MRIPDRFPRETGRDYALRVLKDNIVRLELEPGSMVSENELSSALGLSRTPVREALIELSKVNIVAIYPQKGSRIALIDSHLVDQAYFMRDTLECEVIREVCRKVTASDLDKLRTALRTQDIYVEMSNPGGSSNEPSFMELDNQFHELLYVIAGKELVYRIIQEIVIHYDRIRNLTISYVTPQSVISQHWELLDAIEKKDEKRARELMKNHLSRFQGIKKELIEQHPDYFKDMS